MLHLQFKFCKKLENSPDQFSDNFKIYLQNRISDFSNFSRIHPLVVKGRNLKK